MHETSIALSILAAVEEVFRSTPGARRVVRVSVKVGALSLVDVRALRFALEVASRGTPAEGAAFDVRVEPPLFRCPACGATWGLDQREVEELASSKGIRTAMHLDPSVVVKYLSCPRCGAPGAEVVRGGSVVLEAVELDVEGAGSAGQDGDLATR